MHRLQGAEPELLLAAFKTLDINGKGTVDPEKLRELLTSEGEAFSPEEMEDMLTAAVDSSTELIHYEDYVPKLMVRILNFKLLTNFGEKYKISLMPII